VSGFLEIWLSLSFCKSNKFWEIIKNCSKILTYFPALFLVGAGGAHRLAHVNTLLNTTVQMTLIYFKSPMHCLSGTFHTYLTLSPDLIKYLEKNNFVTFRAPFSGLLKDFEDLWFSESNLLQNSSSLGFFLWFF